MRLDRPLLTGSRIDKIATGLQWLVSIFGLTNVMTDLNSSLPGRRGHRAGRGLPFSKHNLRLHEDMSQGLTLTVR
jgi:hypothetical protein